MPKKKEEQVQVEKNKKDLPVGRQGFVSAVGKRKESRARIRLYETLKELPFGEEILKRGDILVNGKKIGEYFSDKISQVYYSEPLKLTNSLDKYIITIRTSGGGKRGQLGALVHGLSRALSRVNQENRAVLKKAGFLTRDARIRERRKVGMGGKARRKKQSPKR